MDKLPHGILESITSYINEKPVRMHMPGHKGLAFPSSSFETPEHVLDAAKALDVTEVPGLDNLHYPRGAIKAAEKALSRAFGTATSYCLVNGATSGILASLLAIRMTLGQGRIIVPRNVHRSIISGLILSGLEPLFVYPEYDSYFGGYLPVTVSDIKAQVGGFDSPGESGPIGGISDIKGMVVVNPTYFGVARDISDFCFLAGEMDIPVMADEAHGTLFSFSENMPPSAIECGAALVVHGAHKTSQAFTQTGLLHVTQGCIEAFPDLAVNVQEALRLVQSTSPSYLLLASLEKAIGDFQQDSQWVRTVIESGHELTSRLSKVPGIEVRMPRQRDRGLLWDPGKALVGVSGLGISGPQARAYLWERSRIVPEMAGPDYVLLMVTGSDDSNIIDRVVKGFHDISDVCLGSGAHDVARNVARPAGFSHRETADSKIQTRILEQEPPRPKAAMPVAQAFYSKSKPFALKDSLGRISADTVFIYPPGSPIIVPGERISESVVEYLNAAIDCGLEVLGRGYSDHQRELRVFCVEP